MKKGLLIIVMFFVLFCLDPDYTLVVHGATANGSWLDNASSGFDGGDGSEQSPYQINTAAQLAYLSKITQDVDNVYREAHYILTDTINLSAHYWEPIGNDKYNGVFVGDFDGNGKTITGLTIGDLSTDKPAGLFSASGESMIKNLSFEQVAIDTNASTVGTLVGKTGQHTGVTTIYNVNVLDGTVESTVNGTSWDGVGGIIGAATGAYTYLYNSSNAASVTDGVAGSESGYGTIGGLVGLSHSAIIVSCTNTGEVVFNSATSTTNIYAYVGGLVGSGGEIYNSANLGTITVDETAATAYIRVDIGGISSYANVTNSYNSGDIIYSGRVDGKYSSYVGGITATGDDTIIRNSVNFGGFVTTNPDLRYNTISKDGVYNCYWIDTLTQGNTENSSNPDELYNSGSFSLSDGTLTTAGNSTGNVIANDVTTALNRWVDDNSITETFLPVQWVWDSVEAVSHVSKNSVTFSIKDNTNTSVNGAEISLKTPDGRVIERISTTDDTVTFSGLMHGRYLVETKFEGLLTQTIIHNNTGSENAEIKLIKTTAPQLSSTGEILVDSITDLAYISQQVNDGNDYIDQTIILTEDIDLSGYEWTPIGYADINSTNLANYDNHKPFSGVFDGNNKTITGVSVHSIYTPAALFGYTRAAVIKNLNLDSFDISGYSSASAALVALSVNKEYNNEQTSEIDGITVTDVNVVSNISLGKTPLAGGIVGMLYGGIITNSKVVSGDVSANVFYESHSNVGGIVGSSDDLFNIMDTNVQKSIQIKNVTNNANVYSDNRAGGIIGHWDVSDKDIDNIIDNAVNNGNVTGAYLAGGIAGEIESSSHSTYAESVLNSTNNGNIISGISTSPSSTLGGIVALDEAGTLIADCTNNGNLIGNEKIYRMGGIIGAVTALKEIKNCVNNGDITSTVDSSIEVGGITGQLAMGSDCQLVNNINSGDISMTSGSDNNNTVHLGGIIGSASAAYGTFNVGIKNNYNIGTLSSADTGYYSSLGGIVGNLAVKSSISYNYALYVDDQPLIGIIGTSNTGRLPSEVKGNATFVDNGGVLTAVTGTINAQYEIEDITYDGTLISDNLLTALNTFVDSVELNTIEELNRWRMLATINSGYPIYVLPPNYDANGDGNVDIDDLLLIANPLNYNKATDDAQNPNADTNKDGFVNFADIAATRNSKNYGGETP